MLDQYGRDITYLRISITDRCNLRCRYCMPDGIADVGMKNILTFEEIWEIVKAGVSLGITHIRITGGEPLVRKGCVDLIRGIRAISGVETITMTTNGILLRTYAAALKEAGLNGVNVSLDTLDPEEFASLTGRQNLSEVLDGIQAAKEVGLFVKINAVNQTGLNPIPLAHYAEQERIPLRFIEMMPVGYGKAYVGRSNDELRTCLESEFGKSELTTALLTQPKHCQVGSGPAVYYQFPKLTVPVGFISAIHGKFCDSCNRVRLTAQGYLKLCLCYDKGIDLRQILREETEQRMQSEKNVQSIQNEKNVQSMQTIQKTLSQNALSQKVLSEQLIAAMKAAIYKKPAAHCFEHPEEMTEIHEMVKIGG